MVRGVNKRIVEIKNTDSDYFERAILFLKDGETRSDGEIKLLSGEYIRYLTDGKGKRRGIRLLISGGIFLFGFSLGGLLIYLIK